MSYTASALTQSHFSLNHPRFDLTFARGSGSVLYTTDGIEYLDFGNGIAINTLGHNQPRMMDALVDQASKLWHVSELYAVPEHDELIATLCELCFADRAYICSSGAEAVDLAIAAAKNYHLSVGAAEKINTIKLSNIFDDQLVGALPATWTTHYFGEPGPQTCYRRQLTADDLVEVEKAIDETTAAILVDPMGIESGIYPIDSDTLGGLRNLCDFYGVLLIFDETQAGVGRVGEMFAHQAAHVTPDIMAIANGLCPGFPIAACLTTEAVAATIPPGKSGSILDASLLATSVASAVIDIVSKPSFLARVREAGVRLLKHASRLVSVYPSVFNEVRGQGLLLGLQCVPTLSIVMEQLHQERLLCIAANNNTIRLLPPLTVSDREIDDAMQRLFKVARKLSEYASSPTTPYTP